MVLTGTPASLHRVAPVFKELFSVTKLFVECFAALRAGHVCRLAGAVTAVQPRMQCDDFQLPQEVSFRLAVSVRENPALMLVCLLMSRLQQFNQAGGQGHRARFVRLRGEAYFRLLSNRERGLLQV